MVAEIPAPSLYQQLGGRDSVDAVVDEFYRRVLADDRLAPVFATTDLAQLHRHQKAFIGVALGGPNEYTGRAMRQAHAGLGITGEQFTAVAGHLQDSLRAFDVPEGAVTQIIGNVAQLQGDIVER